MSERVIVRQQPDATNKYKAGSPEWVEFQKRPPMDAGDIRYTETLYQREDPMVVEIHCTNGSVSISSVYAPVSSDFLAEYVPMMIKGVKDLAKFKPII